MNSLKTQRKTAAAAQTAKLPAKAVPGRIRGAL
jgi:hypothetical protein